MAPALGAGNRSFESQVIPNGVEPDTRPWLRPDVPCALADGARHGAIQGIKSIRLRHHKLGFLRLRKMNSRKILDTTPALSRGGGCAVVSRPIVIAGGIADFADARRVFPAPSRRSVFSQKTQWPHLRMGNRVLREPP